MDYNAYLDARAWVTFIGSPIAFLLAGSAVLLGLSSILTRAQEYGRQLVLVLTLLLAIGFFVLIWFHLQIFRLVPLIDPLEGGLRGRFLIPLWLDEEKLYFWALILALFTGFRQRFPGRFTRYLNLTLALFVILVVLASNPFATPLPTFHQEIGLYQQALLRGGWEAQVQIFQQLEARQIFFYNSSYMWIHPPLLFVAYAALSVSFLAFIFMLVSGDKEYEQLAYDHSKLGYLMLTVGLLLGYPWAVTAWADESWWWAPKINVTILMWVFYGAYLHSRLYLRRRGMWTATAVIGIVSFSALVFTYLSTYVLPGIHSVR